MIRDYRNHLVNVRSIRFGTFALTLALLYTNWNLFASIESCPLSNSYESEEVLVEQAESDVENEPAGTIVIRSKGKVETEKNRTLISGPTTIQRADTTLHTDHALINRQVGLWKFENGLSVENPAWLFSAKFAELLTTKNQADSKDIQFSSLENHTRINAATITQRGNELKLDKLTLSTCPSGNASWRVEMNKVSFDQTTNKMTARGVALKLGGMPVLYTPYLRWHSEDDSRKFLVPRVDYDSVDGITIGLPYRYRIKQRLSLTITPELMTRRGSAINVALTGIDFGFSGRWAPKDRQYNGDISRELFDLNRIGGAFEPAERWSTNLRWSRARDSWAFKLKHLATSDLNYIQDFSTDRDLFVDLASESSFDTIYVTPNFSSGIRAQRFTSTIFEDSFTQALPEFNAEWQPRWQHVEFNTQFNYAKYSRIDRNVSVAKSERSYLGQGIDVALLERHWAELTATGSVSHTRYVYSHMDQPSIEESREIVSYSLSGALFMLKKADRIRPLEPRFYYLNRSFEKQSQIPAFDDAALVFDVKRLFGEQRQTGLDRIPGSHSLSIGLRSHLHQFIGGEMRGELDVGLIHHFKHELPTEDKSLTQAGWSANLVFQSGLNIEHSYLFGINASSLNETNTLASYRFNNGSFAVVGYGEDKVESRKQAHVGLQFALTDKWHIIGALNQDLKLNKDFEKIAGIGFNGCCLKWRLIYRDSLKTDRYLDIVQSKERTKIYLQLELKGLGGLGSKVESLMARNIPRFNIN